MTETIIVNINGRDVRVPGDSTAAVALAVAGIAARQSVTGTPRGPLCGMGICFECCATIDGRPHRAPARPRAGPEWRFAQMATRERFDVLIVAPARRALPRPAPPARRPRSEWWMTTRRRAARSGGAANHRLATDSPFGLTVSRMPRLYAFLVRRLLRAYAECPRGRTQRRAIGVALRQTDSGDRRRSGSCHFPVGRCPMSSAPAVCKRCSRRDCPSRVNTSSSRAAALFCSRSPTMRGSVEQALPSWPNRRLGIAWQLSAHNFCGSARARFGKGPAIAGRFGARGM